ncbi:hypothetical protein ACFFV7_01530 [Nonomuraea spiralis]|uniref:HEAT repeat domain-containing protein n=1 Tax=Nonomuraea spiralis TaxID=46182 RepID=A0ABV5I5Q1_9ACTN|nr:hypothetical protein [Nonomuraea spiralis]GGS64125.1 hypothetical protein GCM10010176_003070 [Nonomuraea spiralis]
MSDKEPPNPEEPKTPDPQGSDNDPEPGERGERKPHDLGREISARAATPGVVQDRLGTEADAFSSFGGANVRAGQAAGRDLYINYHAVSAARDAPRVWQLGPADLEHADKRFVTPAEFGDLVEAAGARRVLFIRADPGSGKCMAATRLLLGCATVYRLHAGTRLSALTSDVLAKGCGYILADLPGAACRQLTADDLDQLADVFERADARLIVTMSAGGRITGAGVGALVMELGQVTDRVEVFFRHLSRDLDDEAVEQVFGDRAMMDLLRSELAKNSSPGHAALIATYAAEAYKAGEPLAETVGDRLAMLDAAEFERWAEALPDLPTQSMAVAVAVLGGEPYETVSAAAELMRESLEPERPLQSAEPARDAPLVARKRARLRALRAHVVRATVETRHGGAPTEAVRYRDPGFQQKYLLYFWNEYDQARPTLLAWLRVCARHELESVRVRAAVATGVLGARSFDHVRALVIRPWAEGDDPDLRDAAARALRHAAMADPDLGPPVRNLVRAWSADESPQLQATAARCWRIEYDAAGPAAAMKALEELTASADLGVMTAICNSLTEMWEVDGERLEAPALLLAWLGKSSRKPIARLAFLLAAADLVRQVSGVTWPALLYIATRDPVRHREIASLWRDAVTAPHLNPHAKEILAEWAHSVDAHPLARRSFARLMEAVAETPRSATILAHEAGKWAKGSRPAPAAAAEVLRLVREER